MMKKLAVAATVLTVPLAAGACGTTQGDRALSGAGVGATAGLVVGPVGAAVGAVGGAVVGYATDRDDIYLGDPIWK